MRFLKHLFSKFFWVTLLLFIQVGILTVFMYSLSAYSTSFLIFVIVLEAVTLLYICNKNEPTEFKLPWVMLIILLPLFGLSCYILFANPKLGKRQAMRLNIVHVTTRKYIHPNAETKNRLSRAYPEMADLDHYLDKTAYGMGHFGNKVSYYSSGEEMFEDYLKSLKSAENFVFIEYFIIAKGKMWNDILSVLLEKVKCGVEVRIIYDDIGTTGLLRTEYYRWLRKQGIKCYKFNSFKPIISGIYNYRDHRKITVVDGKVAYTGGINIEDVYINEDDRLGYWKDTAVKIEGSGVKNFTGLFLQLYDMTAKATSDYGKYMSMEYEEFTDKGYIYPFGDGPKPYYNDYVGENVFITLLGKARHRVYITTPYLIADYALTNAIKSAAMRGVDVRIIIPKKPDKRIVYNITRSRLPDLIEAGVKIYEYTPGFIHAKSVVVDGRLAFVGTINFDYRSLVHHFECGVVMCDTPCVAGIERDLEHCIVVSKELDLKTCKQNVLVKMTNSLLALLTPML